MATGVITSKIQVLPDDVVGRIAAGEVVERPAAVVKELIDNSLDAGATRIDIDIEQGGLAAIIVTDNGEGMTREDAVLAFRRHATSKVRAEADLWALRTLGFRGEALPSIAAVARVEVATATADAPVGTQVRVDGGTVAAPKDIAYPGGTRVSIRDLFFNTPARKKFLKSVTTEFSHIAQAVQQAALAWPSVHFRLRHNGVDTMELVSAATLRDRVGQIYRGTLFEHMVPVRAEQPGCRIEGWVVQADYVRGSRSPQEWFVNRRAIKNSTLLHAVTDAYGPVLPKGRYPQFVLFLDVDPARVDVNVHPTKREVRFAEKDWIHQVVRQAVKSALMSEPSSASTGAAATERVARVMEEALRNPTAGWAARGVGGESASHRGTGWMRATEPATALPSETVHEPLFPGWAPATTAASTEALRTQTVGDRAVDIVPLGQLAHTFLVACVGDELQIIDQHTAHERVLYERLWRSRQARTVEAQTLLTPVPLELAPHQRVLLEPHFETFEQVGLALERFGNDGVLLRTVPAVLPAADGAALIQGLLEDVEEWRTQSSLDALLHKVVATLACHSAVRAGRPMALPEIGQLVQAWLAEGMIMTCPHGRRVAMRLPSDELAKIFGRA